MQDLSPSNSVMVEIVASPNSSDSTSRQSHVVVANFCRGMSMSSESVNKVLDAKRWKKTPEVIAKIEELMKHDTAGDPMTGLKWTHRTTAKIALELCSLGIQVSANTVAKLLGDLGFSLRVNHKKKSNGSHQNRDEQFAYIKALRERCVAQGTPLVSVDTKKRELVGLFRSNTRRASRLPMPKCANFVSPKLPSSLSGTTVCPLPKMGSNF